MGRSLRQARATNVLSNRNFLLLWSAQAITMTAQNAIWFSLVVIVEDATHSSMQLSFAILSTIVPSILFGVTAGALVDKMDKRTVMVAANFLRTIAILGYLLYDRSLASVYVVNLVFQSIGQFFGPAEYATIPAVVSKPQLVTANSLFNITFTASQVAGIIILAPLFLKMTGPTGLFLTSFVAYLVATLLVSLLPSSPAPSRAFVRPKNGLVKQTWCEVVEGLRFIREDRRTTLAMGHLTLLTAIMLVGAMLLPRFTVSVVGARADDSAFVLAPAGIGILVATTTIPSLTARYGKATLVNLGLMAGGLCFVALSLLRSVIPVVEPLLAAVLGVVRLHPAISATPFLMLIAGGLGLSMAMVVVPSQTIVMERAPEAARGRIFAVQLLLGNLASVLPLLFVGTLGDLLGIDLAMGLIAAALLAAAAFSTWQYTRIGRETRASDSPPEG